MMTNDAGRGIPPHALHLAGSRQCPHLAGRKGSMLTIAELLPEEESCALQSFRMLLKSARLIAEACRALGGWLIEPELLSFDPAEVYFCRDGRRACLTLGNMGLSLGEGLIFFFDRTEELHPGSGAERIADRLREGEEDGPLCCEEILRELSSWELELD